jgi:hypothetical protein
MLGVMLVVVLAGSKASLTSISDANTMERIDVTITAKGKRATQHKHNPQVVSQVVSSASSSSQICGQHMHHGFRKVPSPDHL